MAYNAPARAQHFEFEPGGHSFIAASQESWRDYNHQETAMNTSADTELSRSNQSFSPVPRLVLPVLPRSEAALVHEALARLELLKALCRDDDTRMHSVLGVVGQAQAKVYLKALLVRIEDDIYEAAAVRGTVTTPSQQIYPRCTYEWSHSPLEQFRKLKRRVMTVIPLTEDGHPVALE